jgi:hypothetical protein
MDGEDQTAGGRLMRAADALATCRVFVSLYSSGYFADERCGKEWAYFVSRGRSRATGSGAAIIPGVRDPVEPDRLPPWRGYR